jgi:outer membrane protein assembly factor BamB
MTLGAAITGAPAVASDGTIYVSCNGFLNAFERNGNRKWQVSIGGSGTSYSSPLIDAGGDIILGSSYGLYSVRGDRRAMNNTWSEFKQNLSRNGRIDSDELGFPAGS